MLVLDFFSFSWLDFLDCWMLHFLFYFLSLGVWVAHCRLWSVEMLRENQCFLVECRIVERKCRSLGRLKDVELWRGKLVKTSGRLENVECGEEMWKTSQVGCRNVEHGEETWKTSQVEMLNMERKLEKPLK